MPNTVAFRNVSTRERGTKRPVSLSGLRTYWRIFCDAAVDPIDGDAEFGQIEEHGAIFVGEKVVVGAGGMLEIDPFEASEDLIVEEHPLEKGCGKMAAEQESLGR